MKFLSSYVPIVLSGHQYNTCSTTALKWLGIEILFPGYPYKYLHRLMLLKAFCKLELVVAIIVQSDNCMVNPPNHMYVGVLYFTLSIHTCGDTYQYIGIL